MPLNKELYGCVFSFYRPWVWNQTLARILTRDLRPRILYRPVSDFSRSMGHMPISLYKWVFFRSWYCNADEEQSIYNIITTSQGKLTAIYPALLAVINNIAAYLENISAPTSSKLLQLFASMSSPGFLLSNDSNHDLLQSLLESMNAIIEHQYPSELP